MRIGELADAAGVTTKTIRYYESIDLMKGPDRTPSGYRDYPNEALERLRFIREAQATGLKLSEIHAVLDLKDAGARSCEHTQALLTEHLLELDDQNPTTPSRQTSTGRTRRPVLPTRPRRLHRPQPMPGHRHQPPPPNAITFI